LAASLALTCDARNSPDQLKRWPSRDFTYPKGYAQTFAYPARHVQASVETMWSQDRLEFIIRIVPDTLWLKAAPFGVMFHLLDDNRSVLVAVPTILYPDSTSQGYRRFYIHTSVQCPRLEPVAPRRGLELRCSLERYRQATQWSLDEADGSPIH
jgi:hypothetical protein